MNNWEYFSVIALLVTVLMVGILIGGKVSGENDCSELRNECNTIIRSCNEQIRSITQCETKFICVECGSDVCSN